MRTDRPLADDESGRRRDELSSLRDRVLQDSEGIIVWEAPPVETPSTVDVMIDQVQRLAGSRRYVLVLDLRGSQPPDRETRLRLAHRVEQDDTRLVSVELCVRQDPVVRIVARSVATVAGVPCRVHESLEEAIRAARDRLTAHPGQA